MLQQLGETVTERRTIKRWVVDCRARLLMPGSEREGRLVDLSTAGARLTCDNPPAQGTSGFLTWAGEEHFCTVVWASGSGCGLAFERALPLGVLRATAEMVEEDAGPVADVSRIPMAQKRSRRLSLVTGE